MLVNGMVRVIKIDIERIAEDGGRVLKRNPVFLEITRCFFLVPLTIHVMEYSIVGSAISEIRALLESITYAYDPVIRFFTQILSGIT
jgi:hypothetical protein